MEIKIDPASGFCFGVERAIRLAELAMDGNRPLLSLGELVHNGEENRRLGRKGLTVIGPDEFKALRNEKILIRAHGEPPSTFDLAVRQKLELIDGTCPIVRKLQQRVAAAYREMKSKDGLVVIFGKKEHPEVIGLLGHTHSEALVTREISGLDGTLFQRPVRIFAQTTMDPVEYEAFKSRIFEFHTTGREVAKTDFKAFDTICGQVSGRAPKIAAFARNCDVLIFVSGKNSSNGKVLFQAGLAANPRSYWISNTDEIQTPWFDGAERVGVSGATSTPGWLLTQVAHKISEI